jgi:ATP-dependent metalloprotease FtsH
LKLEWLAGSLGGALLFLAFRGVNMLPTLLLGGLLYFLLTQSGHLRDIGKTKAGSIVGDRPNVTFQDVGGQSVAKRELLEALEFMKDQEQARRLGIRPLKGILLTGPPGTGKTLLAKAAANYTDSVFLSASGSEFIEVYAGLGAQRVRNLFQRARNLAREKKKPGAIIFIDEIEVLAGKRGTQSGHLEYDQTLNQLLVEMDGLGMDDEVRILVIGATNRPDLLDQAIQRPGRFDRTVRVDFPDKAGRLEILKLHLRNKPVVPEVDLDALSKETFGLSGAHLESLCNEAAILALRKKAKHIEFSDLMEALDKVVMGERLESRPSEDEIERVCIHEAGHAIVAERTRPGSVAQVTVSPRGNALGYVRHSPKEDVFIYPRETLQEEIDILLAGALAEDLMLGSRSTGAANDFQRALDIAKRMVGYGMSSLGVVDRDTASPDAIAKATREILERSEKNVCKSLKRDKNIIREVADELRSNETMSGEVLRGLLGKPPDVAWRWRKVPLHRGKPRAKVEI